MKILNLYFKNINSLEGESRIHFDKAPIMDGGVFAITGPNGSGKSSVLDAITLGLYGETFRFDRPAEHVMTKSTAESFSEVEFALGTDKYKASWHVTRTDGNATGELLAPEMKLVQLNGSEQVLENSAQKVREKMTELTGMDFHKFSKSMVLAQGDFAAFLNALDSERMDILEKISGSDIYQDYELQAEEKYNKAETLLQQLEQDLAATPVMDEASIEAGEHDLADFKEQQTELETEQKDIEQQLAWVQNIASLEKQQENLVKQQQQVQNQQQETQQNLDQIAASQNIVALEGELKNLDNKSEAVQQSKKTLDSYASEIEMLQKQLQSANFDESTAPSSQSLSQQKQSIDNLKLKLGELKLALPNESARLQLLEQQIQQKNTALNDTQAWLQEHDADKALLESFPEIKKLTEAKNELVSLTASQNANSKQTKNTTSTLAKQKSEINAITEKNARLKEQIADDEKHIKEMSEGNSLQELQEMLTEQQERVINFRELFDLAGVNSKLSNKGFFSQLLGSKNEAKEEAQLKKEHERLQLEIGKEKNIISTLESAIFNEALLLKMQGDREHLVDGKPCPLCGALKHPYAKHSPAVSNSKQILKDQQKKIKTLQADEVSLSKQIIAVQQQAVKDDQKEGKLQTVRSQWNALANRLNALSMDLTIDNLSLMKDLLQSEKKELNNVNSLLKQATKKQKAIELAKESITTSTLALERITKEHQALSTEWDNRPKESIDQEQAYNQAVEQEKALSEKVEQQLQLLGEKMPGKSKVDVFFKVLNTRKQDYIKQVAQSNALSEEIQPLSEQISSCAEKIESINQSILQYSDNVQQEEVAGLHLSLTEKQKLQSDKETSFKQQETELSTLEQALLDKSKEIISGDLTELRKTIALVHTEADVQQKQLQLSEQFSSLQDKQKDLQIQLESEQAIALTQQTEYDLTGKQSVAKRKLDIAKQEVASLQNKLNKQDGMQQKQETIVAKIEQQKELLNTCAEDKKLLTSENGIHFRHKVQQVISDQLMTQTNQVLEKISGRYYVRKVESEHGLALEIEDTKQKNVRRLPKTLSGGESFIVSLALALGLSEMSNNGHAVDSLFLDEGFGNLDAESLYLAMTTLESLKTHGKVVGIISHVEGVHKRIKTQIEMVKKPNGLSALKMVS